MSVSRGRDKKRYETKEGDEKNKSKTVGLTQQ